MKKQVFFSFISVACFLTITTAQAACSELEDPPCAPHCANYDDQFCYSMKPYSREECIGWGPDGFDQAYVLYEFHDRCYGGSGTCWMPKDFVECMTGAASNNDIAVCMHDYYDAPPDAA